MVKIVCRHPKEVVFLECTKYPSVEALSTTIATIIRTGEPVVLKWTEGVLFSYSLLPPTTDSVMKEFLEGVVYWGDVLYALMPEYKPIIRLGTLDIPVIDVTPNPTLRDAANWMKTMNQK